MNINTKWFALQIARGYIYLRIGSCEYERITDRGI